MPIIDDTLLRSGLDNEHYARGLGNVREAMGGGDGCQEAAALLNDEDSSSDRGAGNISTHLSPGPLHNSFGIGVQSVEEGDMLIQAESQASSDAARQDDAPMSAAAIVSWAKRTRWFPNGAADLLEVVLVELGRNLLIRPGSLGIWIFCAFSARIYVTPLWTWQFIPILSPMYGHGQRWATSQVRTLAITFHVTSGIVMLASGMCQFDVHLRKRWPRLHRMSGYVYAVSGLVCLASLRPLRASLAEEHGMLETSFVEVATAMWLCTTLLAIWCAKQRDFERHRRWMARSMAYAVSPLFQRVANFLVLCPAVLAIRLSLSGLYGHAFFSARWGLTSSDYAVSKLMSPSSELDARAWRNAHAANGTSEGAAEQLLGHVYPLVFSLDGYGVGEQLVFPLSSWAGLVMTVVIFELQAGERLSSLTSLALLRDFGKGLAAVSPRSVGQFASSLSTMRAGFCSAVFGDRSRLVPEGVPCRVTLILLLRASAVIAAPVIIVAITILSLALFAIYAAAILAFIFLFVALAFLLVPVMQVSAAVSASLPFYAAGAAIQFFAKK